MRGQYVHRTKWRCVSCELQPGAAGGVSERGTLRDLYAYTNGDRYSYRRRE